MVLQPFEQPPQQRGGRRRYDLHGRNHMISLTPNAPIIDESVPITPHGTSRGIIDSVPFVVRCESLLFGLEDGLLDTNDNRTMAASIGKITCAVNDNHARWRDLVRTVNKSSTRKKEIAVSATPFGRFREIRSKAAVAATGKSSNVSRVGFVVPEQSSLDSLMSKVDDVILHSNSDSATAKSEMSSSHLLSRPNSNDSSSSTTEEASSSKPTKRLIDKKVYFSRKEIRSNKNSAKDAVQEFRKRHSFSVQQLERFFSDFCNSDSNSGIERENNDDVMDEEEKEEMMHDFLQDWANSEIRGLEDDVTVYKIFQPNRTMAVESVLAYQEQLRDQAVNTSRFSELLRTRSESASHRARMFSMYLALGDALAAAAYRDDE